jgi:hypothetical protein
VELVWLDVWLWVEALLDLTDEEDDALERTELVEDEEIDRAMIRSR